MTEKVRKGLDDEIYTCGFFLGFQKAFDTLSHDILPAKCEHYGVKGIPLNLYKEYLQNCKQIVTIENVVSDTHPINCGIPQGSVLFFLTYISDLHNAIKHTEIHHFADDTNALCSSKSLNDINRKLNHHLKNIVQ